MPMYFRSVFRNEIIFFSLIFHSYLKNKNIKSVFFFQNVEMRFWSLFLPRYRYLVKTKKTLSVEEIIILLGIFFDLIIPFFKDLCRSFYRFTDF